MRRRKKMIELQFTSESALEFRKHQSVRTTFKLSERSITALSLLSAQMGIKQKSLFDHLVSDIKALKTIAEEFENFSESGQRVAKTYVISRATLENLETISSHFNTPRDALVEFSIERILPLIEREKAQHAKRKRIVAELEELIDKKIRLLEEAEAELGEEDPLVEKLQVMLHSNGVAYKQLLEFMKKSEKIEDF